MHDAIAAGVWPGSAAGASFRIAEPTSYAVCPENGSRPLIIS